MNTRIWNGMNIVQISTVENKEEFSKWLNGQTLPYVEDHKNPTDWAYYGDYLRFMYGKPVID